MSLIELDRLAKTYADGTEAVRELELRIEPGEFVVLLGPSGCGKTTTLRMIAGLETPTRGTIRMDTRDVTRLRPSERDVGFVFQFYALYPHMTAAANIAFPLQAKGVPAAERRAAVAAVAERLGLTELLGARPAELSGGDQQRVALARAMVRRPAVWLMDEPLGTLDADRRMEMCEFLRTQQLELGITTVYVTHDQDEAMRLADRIVVMDAGRVLQVGPPIEVYDRPASLFVAGFVGSPGMNLIDGRVSDGAFVPAGSRAPIRLSWRPRDGEAILGVRPESLRAAPGGPIRGRVLADEYFGSSRCVHLECDFGRLIARMPADGSCGAGDELRLEIAPGGECVFSPESTLAEWR